MNLNEELIKKVSIKLMVPEKVVGAIIAHQFDSAYEALKTNNSVEIYDFGKFVFNEKKAVDYMEKLVSQQHMYEMQLEDGEERNIELRLETVEKNIHALLPKLEIDEGNN